jgi:hypothetical protein
MSGDLPPADVPLPTEIASVSTGSLKVDIKKLLGPENYISWRAHVAVYLRHLKVLDVVNGTTPAPTDKTSSAYDEWETRDTTAQLALLTAISVEWQHLVAQSSSSAEGWTKLQDQFDRQNIISLSHLLNKATTSKMESSETLPQYLARFDSTWTQLKTRVHNAPADDTMATGLERFLDNEQIKASYLLLSLPETYSNVVDNLVSKKGTYADAYAHLMDLPSTSASNAKALAAQAKKKKEKATQSSKKKPTSSDTGNQLGKNECSFCKKWNREFVGHTYKICTVLKDYKNGVPVMSGTSGKANVAITPSDDHAKGVAFSSRALANLSLSDSDSPSSGTALGSHHTTKQFPRE